MTKLHYHTRTEETNILFFPFQCTKTLIISCILIMSIIGIPIFIAYATLAAKQKTLPHYPPLKQLFEQLIKTITHFTPILLYILYFYITKADFTITNTIILTIIIFVLPTQLLSNKWIAPLKPALSSTYLLRMLIGFALTSSILYLAMLIELIPTTGIYINYFAVVISFYYLTIFALTLLAEEIKENTLNSN